MNILKLIQSKKIQSVLWWILFTLIITKLLFYLISNRQFFTRIFDPVYYGDLYSKSQYVVGSRSVGGIGDDGLYAFAGYYYLFQKGDVSAVNFEHPPLGKYLIGLSILIFRNENLINIIYFSILLFVTYKIGNIILKNKLLSLLSVGIISFDPLFLDNLIRSLLDLPFTLFFILGIYFFLMSLHNAKYHYFSMLFWGISFSTRFFPALLIIYGFLFLVIFLYKRKDLSILIKASFLIPIVYLLSHISFFVYHPSLVEFLRHKKWMLAWFTGSPKIFGNIWRNIFTGFYIDTTNKLMKNEFWILLIPIIIIFSLIPTVKIQKKNSLEFIVLYGLNILYLAYVTILTDGNQKFMMPIYPMLCIMAVSNFTLLYSIIASWKKSN
ncbi:glycosyltransferase family 39 protein [Candidatus Gottesmanbacteria bacterium]|nr:glycosyltransferase family 39 protein [Candidatus Gottesmanbacteria bacterium]